MYIRHTQPGATAPIRSATLAGTYNRTDAPAWNPTSLGDRSWSRSVPTMESVDADHRVGRCRPSSRSMPTIESVDADHGVGRCRPSSRSMPTIESVDADHRVGRCRPSSRSMPTIESVDADHRVGRCRPSSRSMPTIESVKAQGERGALALSIGSVSTHLVAACPPESVDVLLGVGGNRVSDRLMSYANRPISGVA